MKMWPKCSPVWLQTIKTDLKTELVSGAGSESLGTLVAPEIAAVNPPFRAAIS